MQQQVWEAIRRYDLIQHGDTVIVALSGGADSMALFHFLLQGREELGIRLAAAHFEHGLRGEASLADAVLVRETCEAAGVALYLEHGSMGGQKPPRGQSVEEWARKLRYAFFERLAFEHGAKVATAHNRDDNAETVLFHAIRGAGTRGLAGIPFKRGVFIRPLLLASRDQVEAYCKANDLHYAIDATNLDESYARNRLRMNVLPELEKAHFGAKKNLSSLAEDMRELDEWLEAQAEQLLCKAEQQTTFASGHSVAALLAAPAPVRGKALRRLAGQSATREDVRMLEAVLAGTCAGHQLKGGRTARTCDGMLVLEREAEEASYYHPLGEGTYEFAGGFILCVTICKIQYVHQNFAFKGEKSDKKGLTFTADYDKIARNSVWRTRQPGDFFRPKGKGGRKTLKKWMNETGVPRSLRGSLPLLAQGSEVAWMYGSGFAAGTEVDDTTTRVLVVQAKYNQNED